MSDRLSKWGLSICNWRMLARLGLFSALASNTHCKLLVLYTADESEHECTQYTLRYCATGNIQMVLI